MFIIEGGSCVISSMTVVYCYYMVRQIKSLGKTEPWKYLMLACSTQRPDKPMETPPTIRDPFEAEI